MKDDIMAYLERAKKEKRAEGDVDSVKFEIHLYLKNKYDLKEVRE